MNIFDFNPPLYLYIYNKYTLLKSNEDFWIALYLVYLVNIYEKYANKIYNLYCKHVCICLLEQKY